VAEDDVAERIQQSLAKEADRGLGDIPMRATAALSPFSWSQMEAAQNLLDKALRALDEGDEPRARRFVERAVALPFDEHEQVHPGPMTAHQQLFEAVTDAFDNGGDEWLSAAIDTFASAPEEARYCLRDVLTAVLQDYDLSDGDRRRLRGLIRDVPERDELAKLDLKPEEMATAVLEVLQAAIRYVDAYEESFAVTHGED
jgi:hypothetical protein